MKHKSLKPFVEFNMTGGKPSKIFELRGAFCANATKRLNRKCGLHCNKKLCDGFECQTVYSVCSAMQQHRGFELCYAFFGWLRDRATHTPRRESCGAPEIATREPNTRLPIIRPVFSAPR